MPGEPRKIGRYEVNRVLGHGAMGVVYLAFDPLLKRPLAIKTVRESGSEDGSLLRFQREAEISARLSHPNIVTIHDVGQDPEVGPFLAMEYIDGLPLSDLIQQGIPTESAVRLLLQGMSALQAAEHAGITHRDVKPANILVSHDGRLKLMDFGIARGEGTRLTQTGQIMGTPSYTSPEALAGVDPSSVSDRYAFAVTAFQMLTGELPFECSTIAATLFRIAHDPPLFPESMGPGVAWVGASRSKLAVSWCALIRCATSAAASPAMPSSSLARLSAGRSSAAISSFMKSARSG
jgi:serine/threonine protein kinase